MRRASRSPGYDEKEAEYPVMAGFYKFSVGSGQQSRIDREALVDWARQTFRSPNSRWTTSRTNNATKFATC